VTAWRLLPLLLVLAACAGGRTPPDAAVPPDDTERLVRLAEARAQAGEHAEAVLLLDEVARNPSAAFADRALLGLTRSLCNPEYAGHDYHQAYLAADRLVREYPDSRHAGEARAWRDLLVAYLARGQDLDRYTIERKQLLLELERLKQVDLELERRTRELQRRTQELERLKQVDLELERRTQELERLKRLDLELEQRKRKP
jgi:outer membrane protein assembly factor BamD (BamD/ComL family)